MPTAETMNTEQNFDKGEKALRIGSVVQRTFRAYNKEGIVKLQSTASTMEEAIQKTYDE